MSSAGAAAGAASAAAAAAEDLLDVEAIPFITLDEATGQFTVGDEAVAYLSSLRGRIAVVTMAGASSLQRALPRE